MATNNQYIKPSFFLSISLPKNDPLIPSGDIWQQTPLIWLVESTDEQYVLNFSF